MPLSLAIVFATWDPSEGRVCHSARSIDVDGVYGGFQFRAFCGAGDRGDEIAVDLLDTVGCERCRQALAERGREVAEPTRI